MGAVLGLAPTVLAFAGLNLLLGLCSGVAGVPAGAMLADIAPEGRSGTAVGIFRFAGDVGMALGPLFAGFAIGWHGFGAAFALSAIPLAAVAVFAATSPETLPRPSLASPEAVAEAERTGLSRR